MKKSTIMILLSLCLLCGCQKTNIENVDVKEGMGEIVAISDITNTLYINSPDKNGGYDLEIPDNKLITDFKIGDLVKFKYTEEEKVDLTGKNYKLYHLVSIEETDGYYTQALTLNDIVDFDIKEINIEYVDDNAEAQHIILIENSANELFAELSKVKVYKDYISDIAIGGSTLTFEIIGDNKTIKVEEYDTIKIISEDETIECGYHRIEGYLNYRDIIKTYYETYRIYN